MTQIIKKSEETKFVIGYPTNFNTSGNLSGFTAFTSGITNTNEVYSLIPFITQGTDDFQRIGNVIEPTSLTAKVNVCLFNENSMSVYADIYFCTSKNIKDYELTNQIPTGELLNRGDGTNVLYDGYSATAMYPVNRSEFTLIKHKRVKLQKAIGDPNTALSGGGPAATSVFPQHTYSFSVKVPLPKTLKYEASAKRSPSNYFPFMMCGFVGSDANGNNAPILPVVQLQAQTHLYYKDA